MQVRNKNLRWTYCALAHGMVKIVSESNPGEGAPVDEEPSAPGGDSKPEEKTILLAEDQPAIQFLITVFLKQNGFRVLSADDGPAALELARGYQGEIDLLLSDVSMPEMDGPTLARELKTSRPGIKTLLMSGDPNKLAMHDSGLDAGFLQKPFALPKLLEKVIELTSPRAGP